MSETTYVVLRRNNESPGWEDIGTIDGASAQQAIRNALNGRVVEGTYVAVPTRSWKPLQVSAVQTTVLKLEAPGA
jgi:hypothetical protein